METALYRGSSRTAESSIRETRFCWQLKNCRQDLVHYEQGLFICDFKFAGYDGKHCWSETQKKKGELCNGTVF